MTIKTIEVCTVSDIGLTITGADAPPLVAALNKYLEQFAKPIRHDEKKSNFLVGDLECLNCGRVLNGALGTFQWGLCHGEGTCSNCGWPCRLYHSPKDDEGAIFEGTLERMLQYHPNCVSKQESDTDGLDQLT